MTAPIKFESQLVPGEPAGWNMLGVGLACASNMIGISLAYAWNMHGLNIVYAWSELGICLGYARNRLGSCFDCAWNRLRIYNWNMPGVSLFHIYSIRQWINQTTKK